MASTARKALRNGDLKHILPLVPAIKNAKQWEHSLHALEQTQGKSMAAACKIGERVVEGCHKTANDLMEFSREAISCSSFDEFYDLQRKAASAIMTHWLDEVGHAQCALFNAYGIKCVSEAV